jgi:adenine-specific DNA-methyltransferase
MPFKPVTARDPESRSADLTAEQIGHLRTLFPAAFREGSVDLEVLRQLLGGAVDEREERYGLNWHGKRAARQLALTPSAGTLRPAPGESVEWEATRNLIIEGENLEVLKLLQKPYAGKVKLIYIDPPYNTGKDFIYPDNFRDSIRHYLKLTGQTGEDGQKFTTNPESSGRFHTDWLNMMYPRLFLARNLLRQDGAIFVSIDDHEVAHLRLLMDEIFGPENFVATVVWEGAFKNDAAQIGTSHEYVVVFARSIACLPRGWKLKKSGLAPILQAAERLRSEHGDDFAAASAGLASWFRANKASASFSNRRFHLIDQNGVYKEDDPTAPGGRRFDLVSPVTGKVIPLREGRGWAFTQGEFERLALEGRISFLAGGNIMVRRYLHETDSVTPQSVIYQPARSASERLRGLLGTQAFEFPKDEGVAATFVEMASSSADLVLDFFAGSGTMGHAVMAQNAADGGSRRYILVQLPEPTGREDYSTIAEICRERVRRAAERVRAENPLFHGDLGFRAFRLDLSNIREWDPQPEDVAGAVQGAIEHLRVGRSEDDILYELLLKLGLDLALPLERRMIAGKTVHSAGAGTLFACLAPAIAREEVEALALGIAGWRDELAPAGEPQVVFRDSAFADDVAKSNGAAILQQHGFAAANLRSI